MRAAEPRAGRPLAGRARGRLGARAPGGGATDRALEELVRAAFRQSVRYNLILARGSTMDARYVERWARRRDAERPRRRRSGARRCLFVGIHMGVDGVAGAVSVARITGRLAVAPMETLGDPLCRRT